MMELGMNQLFGGYYCGRRVFVTGHTGFKGSWLTQWLLLLGAEVTGYSIGVPTQPSLYESLGLSGQIQDVRGDVRRREDVQTAMDQVAPEVVIHMAAQALVLPSYADPLTTFETNVMGTANVLEAARHCPSVRSVVMVTTDKCYANNEWQYGYRESDALGGHDPYSASKAAAEMVVASYRSSFFDPGSGSGQRTGVASVRSGNVIGGGDWAADRLIPDCTRALAEGKTIVVRNPDSVRPWQHVLESLSGYLWLGALLTRDPARYGGAWNFGPDPENDVSVEQLVGLVCQAWGGAAQFETGTSAHALSEAGILRLDCTKARSQLGWHPVYDVGEAVQQTVTWYRATMEDAGQAIPLIVRSIGDYVQAAHSNGVSWAAMKKGGGL
ncbi:MAG: CDP-glucose 4,6-dehydratase [Candidatus Cryosericum sp.]